MPRLLKQRSNIRFAIALLAMLGAIWAAVDVHQHQPGMHNIKTCSICSLEDSASHGFVPQLVGANPLQFATYLEPACGQSDAPIACIRRLRIRAPPLA